MAITINPYAGISNNTTKDSEILTNLVEGAPADLDTLKEISAVIQDNQKKLEHLEQNQPEVYTKEEIDSKGYLTEHQSLDNYALKSELPDISNLATKDEIPTDYITTIPEATIDTLGGVKKITVDTLAEDADITTVVTAYNNLISKLTEAGLVGSLII